MSTVIIGTGGGGGSRAAIHKAVALAPQMTPDERAIVVAAENEFVAKLEKVFAAVEARKKKP